MPQLRRSLAEHGVEDPMWAEVPKSRKAPKQVKRFLEEGAEHFFVWGGDGMAQRCIDTLAGSGATVAIIPAGTANLLASNLGLPTTIDGAVANGLSGRPRRIDVINLNGERFAVMAGTGFDANMIRSARRRPQGQAGPCRLRLDRHQELSHPAVQGQDRGRRQPLVQRAGELHPGRKRRRAVRRRAGVRRRRAG